MTAHPDWTEADRSSNPEPRLLTVADYMALGETEPGYTELQEGRLLMSPSPVPDHNNASSELRDMLKPQLPADLEVLLDLDVDLELAPPDKPGFIRRPDALVVRRSARQRVRREGGLIRAAEVVLVVEVVSPGSRRTDNVIKRSDYADAGIPYYWIIDLEPPISLVACHQAEPAGLHCGGYQDSGAFTGRFRIDEPFPVELSLDELI